MRIISGLTVCSPSWGGKAAAVVAGACGSGRAPAAAGCVSAARWPRSVVCHVNGLYRQRQGVASSRHFLLLRPVSSRSQLCTSGAILPAGRVGWQPRDCFCFYGASGWGQPGVGRGWKVTPLDRAEGPCAPALFFSPLIKHGFKRDDTTTLQMSAQSPGPTREGTFSSFSIVCLLPRVFPRALCTPTA